MTREKGIPALVIDRADSAEQPGSPIIETNIPARLERLLWAVSTLVVIALGITGFVVMVGTWLDLADRAENVARK